MEKFLHFPLNISIILLIIFTLIIIIKYIIGFVKTIKEKKWLKFIFMISVILFVVLIYILEKYVMCSIFRAFSFYLLYIILVITIPLVVIGFAILKKYKNKTNQILTIVFTIIFTIIIYICQYDTLSINSKKVLDIFDEYSLKEIFYTKKQAKKEEKFTIDSFNGYIQKMAKKMYLDKYDIVQILNIANLRKDKIKIIYKDDHENITIEKTNKDEGWKEEILEKLEGNYYKFNCDYEVTDYNSPYVKNIILTIEKYQEEEIQNTKEVNEDIIIKGKLRPDLVKRIDKYEN